MTLPRSRSLSAQMVASTSPTLVSGGTRYTASCCRGRFTYTDTHRTINMAVLVCYSPANICIRLKIECRTMVKGIPIFENTQFRVIVCQHNLSANWDTFRTIQWRITQEIKEFITTEMTRNSENEVYWGHRITYEDHVIK